MRRTPVTQQGLRQFDHLPPEEAIRLAWVKEGNNLYWHNRAKRQVRETMPVLARALDRLVAPK